MVWVLSTVPTSLEPASSAWYVTGPATVGRTAKGLDAKQPDLVINDAAVSKVHISLSLDTKEGGVSSLLVQDHSRYGTVIDGLKLESGSRELHSGSLIKLSNKISLSVREERLLLLSDPKSVVPASDLTFLQRVGSHVPEWSSSATHALLYPQQQAWAGLLAAVLKGLPIVLPSWLAECCSQPVWPSSLPDCTPHAAHNQIPLPSCANTHGGGLQPLHPHTTHPAHFSRSILAAANRTALDGMTFHFTSKGAETEALAFCIQHLGGSSTTGLAADGQHVHTPGVVVVCESCAEAGEAGATSTRNLLVAIATCSWPYIAGVACAAVQAAADKVAAAAALECSVHSEDMTEEEEEEIVQEELGMQVAPNVNVTTVVPPTITAPSLQHRHTSQGAASHKRPADAGDEDDKTGDPNSTPGKKRRKGHAAADTGGPRTITHNTASPSAAEVSAVHLSTIINDSSSAPSTSPGASPGRSTKAYRMAQRAAHGKKHSSAPQVDVAAAPHQPHQQAPQPHQAQQQQQQQQQQARQLQQQQSQQQEQQQTQAQQQRQQLPQQQPPPPQQQQQQQPLQSTPSQARQQPSQKKPLDFMADRTQTIPTGSDASLVNVCHVYEAVAMVVDPAHTTHRAGGRGSTHSSSSVVDYSPFRKVSSQCGNWATTARVPLVLESVDQFRAHEDNDAYHRADQAKRKLGKQADVLFQTTQGTQKRQR